jgi:hypothetical protein
LRGRRAGKQEQGGGRQPENGHMPV